jgi:Tfp pilus assembly protein PilP
LFGIALPMFLMGGCGGGGSSNTSGSSNAGNSTEDDQKQAATNNTKIDKEELKQKGQVAFEASDIKRDPFAPDFDLFGTGDSVVEEKQRQKSDSPLERFGLNEYSLIAVISEVAIPKAMVVGPNGDGYMVSEGTTLGKEGYEIAEIREEELRLAPSKDQGGEPRFLKLQSKNDGQFEPTEGGNELTEEEREALQKLRTGAGRPGASERGGERSVEPVRQSPQGD